MAINWRGVSGPNLAGATQLLNNAASGFGQSLTDLSNQVTDYSKELKNKAIDKATGQLAQEAAQEGADLKAIHAKGVSMLMDQGASFKEAQERISSSLNSNINLRNDAQSQEKYQHDLGRRSTLEGQQDATHASNLATNELNRANTNQLMTQRDDLHKDKVALGKANLTKASQGIKENALDIKTKEIDSAIANDSSILNNTQTLSSLDSDFATKTQPKIDAAESKYNYSASKGVLDSIQGDKTDWASTAETYRAQMKEDFLSSGNSKDYTDSIIEKLGNAKIPNIAKKSILDQIGNPSSGFILNTVNQKELNKQLDSLISKEESRINTAKNNIEAYTSEVAGLRKGYDSTRKKLNTAINRKAIEIRNKYNK